MKVQLLSFLLLITHFLIAQKGTVTGIVSDEKTGETLVGAVVIVSGSSNAVATDFDGKYILELEEGVYALEMKYISYAETKVENVVVKAGETTTVDIKAASEENLLGEIEIKIKVDKSGEEILLAERRKSAEIVESIGSQKLSEQGVTDVQTGVTKLAGISKVSSGGVFVRGLGDRYNNAYLNGLPIASPDPNKKVIDLNLFPTAIVRNISVSKVYNVDQFADMSGAGINIITKDGGAGNDYVAANIGVNYNTNTTFKDFYTSKDGDLDYLGFTGNGRKEPETDFNVARYVLSNTEENPFDKGFGVSKISAPLDNKFGVQYVKSFEGEKVNSGLVFSTSYRNRYRFDEGENKILDNNQNPTSSLYRERYRFTTNLTGLLGGFFEINDKHKINLNYIFLNGSNNNYLISQGNTDEDDSPETMDQRFLRNRYLERRMNDVQLIVQHDLSEKIDVNWGGSYTNANTIEPDRRDLKAITGEGEEEWGVITPDQSDQKQRYFQKANEDEIYAYGEANVGFGGLDNNDEFKNKIVGGVQSKMKTREMQQASYQLVMEDELFNANSLELSAIDDYINDENYQKGLFSYEPIIRAADYMQAERSIMAAYSYVDFNPMENLKILPGVRVEYTDQYIYYKEQKDGFKSPVRVSPYQKLDILPALNIKYVNSDISNLRFGISKTLVRPNFRELLPLVYFNQNLNATSGNPNLKNSTVYNFELKGEIFPEFDELVAFSFFYKKIYDPIEQVRSGINYISYFNVSEADVAGVEFEFTKRLNYLFKKDRKIINGLLFGGNVSLLYSNISLDLNEIAKDDPQTANTLANITNQSRPLQGASPLLLNGSITYDSILIPKSESTSISLVYNRFASRIFSAGTFTRGDIYEKAYGTLDFVFRNSWKSGFSVRFAVKNILNPYIQRYQSQSVSETQDFSNQSNEITQSFRSGINFGLTIGYKIGLNKKEEF